MLTSIRAVLFALVIASAGAVAATGPAAAAPCQNGGSCAISGHRHSGGGGGTAGGGGGGGGNTGPGLGCPTNQGPQIVCTPGNPPAAQPQIPPQDIAERARDQIILPAPHVNTAPAERTYVQLQTGLWVDQATDYVTRSITLTITGETVTATATPETVTWDMGEGTVVCHGPGTPRGTRCGYTYTRSSADRPGRTYTISATISWNVAWACVQGCQGGGGLAPMTMTTAAPLAVGEIQTESDRG